MESERAATALAHAELQEAQLHERLQNLATALSESKSSTGAAQEQAAQLQSTLWASEHDRRTLQVSGQEGVWTLLDFVEYVGNVLGQNVHMVLVQV